MEYKQADWYKYMIAELSYINVCDELYIIGMEGFKDLIANYIRIPEHPQHRFCSTARPTSASPEAAKKTNLSFRVGGVGLVFFLSSVMMI
jgi:hypothetical protein